MTAKILFTGETHTNGGPNGAARSSDGLLDIQLPEPHPAAERLFAAAWSACFIGAIELAASRKKIALPDSAAIDATIELLIENNAFFLRAHEILSNVVFKNSGLGGNNLQNSVCENTSLN